MPSHNRKPFPGKALSASPRRLALALAACFTAGTALALPVGPQIVAGSAAITQAGNALTVANSPGAILNWQTFNIGANERVRFEQASASSAVLNRVLANDPSVILGQLSSNGRVWLVNPAGILVGPGARIDTAAFVASTLNITNADFLANKLKFDGLNSAGTVVNQGSITTPLGGSVYLIGKDVTNEGIITTPQGETILAAGQKVELIDTATPGVKVEVRGQEGNVTNLGQITAEAGRIGIAGALIKNAGTLNASSVESEGGRIFLRARNLAQDGHISAASAIGAGGRIDIQAERRLIQTDVASIDASGATHGGDIGIATGLTRDGGGAFISGTLVANATRGAGGNLTVTGRDLYFAAARLDASGATDGGQVRLGGDYQGKNPDIANAWTNYLNGTTRIFANGGSGQGGRVIVWSESQTTFGGSIEAKGGTPQTGGFVEVSGKDNLHFAGNVAARQLLLDPKNIVIDAAGAIAGFQLVDPNPGTNNNFGFAIGELSTGNIAVTSFGDSFNASASGAVYLFNGTTGALISTLRGSNANDQVGNAGITPLTNGNYVVSSPNWNGNLGAVTWGNGSTGINGVVSSGNSLVGSTANDMVGYGDIWPLTNGNYVVSSPDWNGYRGAATWGNGSTGTSGVVSSSNSLVGSSAGDYVSYDGIATLANGNYVVSSTSWNGGRGAATWGNGSTGITGAVSSVNSLVGSAANDMVGNGFIWPLSNGNYVVSSPGWNGYRGAATWGNGNTGISGTISSTNSLVGSTANDMVGYGYIYRLTNGNYVVDSYQWNSDRGAVTWGNGSTGISGVVSSSNSLVGSSSGDKVGIDGVFPLTNGNYVVNSSTWNSLRGAVTWGNGNIGISGAVSSSNSLVGSNVCDFVGQGFTVPLVNGNYVVTSPSWNGNLGAVTWGNGSAGISGAVSSSNSLVGSTAGDRVGIGMVTPLASGNYVVSSYTWNGNIGAATWGNGSTGSIGVVSSSNSLVGSAAGDQVGCSIAPLSNGNYVVSSYNWNGNIGAATWGNGSIGSIGVVSSSNSLVGSVAGDQVGNSITPLSNGNYVVGSPFWNGNIGAATWGNGNIGSIGVVSSSNSLVGSIANDKVGSDGSNTTITSLNNGNYVVGSSRWNGDKGAVTWGSGTAGVSGTIGSGNSLVGSSIGELVGGFGWIVALTDGNYVVERPNWTNGAYAHSGRVDVMSGVGGASALPQTFGTSPSATATLAPSTLTALLNAGTAVTLQANNDITVNSAVTTVKSGAKGGDLTLQAGRSILLNANISTDNGNFTAIANEKLANGVVDAEREAGAAILSMAVDTLIDAGTGAVELRIRDGAGKTYSTAGGITLRNVTAGSITLANQGLSAGAGITTGALTTVATGTNGGSVNLSTANGSIEVGTISTAISGIANGNGGSVVLTANGTTSDIRFWRINSGVTNSGLDTGHAGDIWLTAGRDIISTLTNNDWVALSAVANTEGWNGSNAGAGGHISLTAGRDIQLPVTGTWGAVVTSSQKFQSGNAGDAGAVDMTAGGSIVVGDILAASFKNDTLGSTGKGGNVTLNAATGIQVGKIDASSWAGWHTYNTSIPVSAGAAGNITLATTGGNITLTKDLFAVSAIPASGDYYGLVETGMTGQGGLITLTTPGTIDVAGQIGIDTRSWMSTESWRITTAIPGTSGSVVLNSATSIPVGTSLTLTSGGAINAPITLAGELLMNDGAVALNAAIGDSGGLLNINGATVTPNAAASVSVERFTLTAGGWNQVAATLPGFTATDFRLDGGSFVRAKVGAGETANPYQLVDIYGVQGMGSAGMLGKHYVLANDIDASGTINWNSGAGFLPIGDSYTPFTGTLNGQGYTVNGLRIDRSYTSIGLFGYTGSNSEIRNLGLIAVNFHSDSLYGAAMGGVVGVNYGNLDRVYATGTLTAAYDKSVIGGLVGDHHAGSISNSYSTASVTVTNGGGGYANAVGGLVGFTVVGSNILNSYSTGAVTSTDAYGGDRIGGLVGDHRGSITNSYSTSLTTSTGSQGVVAGGLVGLNQGSVATSYAAGNVICSSSGSCFAGGLIGENGGVITHSYWDTTVAGATGVGAGTVAGTGWSSTQMKDASKFSGWDIASTGGSSAVWRIYEGQTYPLLRNLLKPITVTANAASKTYDGNTFSGGNGATYSDTNATLLGTLAYGGTSQGAINVGSYTITPSGLYSTQQGYDISYVDGALTIGSAALTAIIGNLTGVAEKVYNGTNLATLAPGNFLLTGWAAGEGATVTKTSGTYGQTGVGSSILVTVSLASSDYSATGSTLLSNYTLPTSITGNIGKITARPVSVTAGGKTKIYGQADPTFTYSVAAAGSGTGLVGGDRLAGSLARAAGENVGNYVIQQGTLSAGSNYQINYTPASLTVTQRNLTLTANNQSKTYGATDPGLTWTVGGLGLVNGDTLTGSLSAPTGASATAGSHSITQGTLAASSNYNVTNFTAGTLTVSKAILTATAHDQTRTYGDTNPTLTGVLAGFVYGEDSSVLTNAPSYSTSASQVSDVGSYAIVGAGGAAQNYSFSYVPGTLAITQRPLTISVSGGKVYDRSTVLSAPTLGLDNVANSDNLSVTGTTRFADWNVGSGKVLSASGLTLSGPKAGNYTWNTDASGTGSITQLASVNWIGGSNGVWSDAANWFGGALPDHNNVAEVIIPATVAGPASVTITNPSVLDLGNTAITSKIGSFTLETSGGLTTGSGLIRAPVGRLSLITHSPMTIGSGGLQAASGITLTATTAEIGSTILINGPLTSTSGPITLSAYNDITLNANLTATAIQRNSQIGRVQVAAGVSVSETAPVVITTVPVEQVTQTVSTSLATATTVATAPATDSTPTVEKPEPSATPTSSAVPANTTGTGSGSSLLLASLSQTIGGGDGQFGSAPATSASGSTSGATASSTTAATSSGNGEKPAATAEKTAQAETKSEAKSEAKSKEKREEKAEAKKEEKKEEKNAKDDKEESGEKKPATKTAQKKVAQCS